MSIIYIELDRKSPELKFFIPSNVTVLSRSNFFIEANEGVSDYQEIYIVDSSGVRHDYLFERMGNNLLSLEVNFFGFPIGLATIYATLEDEVGNISELYSESFEVREAKFISRLETKHSGVTLTNKDKKSVYQYGNTIKFECEFFDSKDEQVDPDEVRLTIYNYKYQAIAQISINSNDKIDVGRYSFDYVTESKEQKLFYEWYGKLNEKPALKRGEFMTKFI